MLAICFTNPVLTHPGVGVALLALSAAGLRMSPAYHAQSSESSHAPHIVHFYPAVSLSCQIIIGSSRDDGCVLLAPSRTRLTYIRDISCVVPARLRVSCPGACWVLRTSSLTPPTSLCALSYLPFLVYYLAALIVTFSATTCIQAEFNLSFCRIVGWVGHTVRLAASFWVSGAPLPTAIQSSSSNSKFRVLVGRSFSWNTNE